MGFAWALPNRRGIWSTVRKNNIVWHPTMSTLALRQLQTLSGCNILAMMTSLSPSTVVICSILQSSHVTEVPVPGCKAEKVLEVCCFSPISGTSAALHGF